MMIILCTIQYFQESETRYAAVVLFRPLVLDIELFGVSCYRIISLLPKIVRNDLTE